MLHHTIDTAATRSLPQRIFQLRQILTRARGNDLHMPVLGIPHPSAQTNLRRLLLHKPAETNALYAAFDEIVAHHGISSFAEPSHPRNTSRNQKRRSQSALPLRLDRIYARLM